MKKVVDQAVYGLKITKLRKRSDIFFILKVKIFIFLKTSVRSWSSWILIQHLWSTRSDTWTSIFSFKKVPKYWYYVCVVNIEFEFAFICKKIEYKCHNHSFCFFDKIGLILDEHFIYQIIKKGYKFIRSKYRNITNIKSVCTFCGCGGDPALFRSFSGFFFPKSRTK